MSNQVRLTDAVAQLVADVAAHRGVSLTAATNQILWDLLTEVPPAPTYAAQSMQVPAAVQAPVGDTLPTAARAARSRGACRHPMRHGGICVTCLARV